MPANTAMSFNCPNFSGMLYMRGRAETPLLAMIGGRTRYSNAVKFAVGQSYALGDIEIPRISEAASLVAPPAEIVTRAQDFNVTQIFQEAVNVSHAKMANMGTLNGINVAGQQANPIDELTFQIKAAMERASLKVEKAFIQGVRHEAISDHDANQTGGFNSVVRTNVLDLADNYISFWDVADLLAQMGRNGAPTASITLWCSSDVKFQLTAEAQESTRTQVVDMEDKTSGINITRIITPAGTVDLVQGQFLPTGTAFLLNLGVVAPVEQITPGFGNFYLHDLAVTGAGIRKELFGQAGLDYGPEFYHGKITGIKAGYKRPSKVISVNVENPVGTYDMPETITSVSWSSTDVKYSDGTYNATVKAINSDGSISFQNEILTSQSANGPFDVAQTSHISGTGALSIRMAAYLPEGGYMKLRVTGSGSTEGSAETEVVYVEKAVLASANLDVAQAGQSAQVSAFTTSGNEVTDYSALEFQLWTEDGDLVTSWVGTKASPAAIGDNYAGQNVYVVVNDTANGIYDINTNTVTVSAAG